MQRDMNLVRQILLDIEAREDTAPRPVQIAGVDPAIVMRHVEMLNEAGFLEAKILRSGRDFGIAQAVVSDLTWEGHDFLAALKDEGVWNKIKHSLSPAELAGMPLTALKALGVALLTHLAKQKL